MLPSTCDQIANIPTNKVIEAKAAASCMTARNMTFSQLLYRNEEGT
jgi:hypothetical protein